MGLVLTADGRLVERAVHPSAMESPSISASLIVRDEEATIERCVASVRPFVAEVCVLDTGSTDGTLEILDRLAGEPGAPIRVARAEWPEHFGLARTMALDLVRHEWVFWIDGDEILVNGPLLAEAVSGAAADGVTALIMCRGADLGENGVPRMLCEHVRIFRADAGRWRGCVGELWWPDDPHARRWITTSARPDPCVPWILHGRTALGQGYQPERYEPLLVRGLEDDDSPLEPLNLARLRFMQRRDPEARDLLETFLAAGVQFDPYYASTWEALMILAELCRRTNDMAAAREATRRLVDELEKAAALPAFPPAWRDLLVEMAGEERGRLRGVDPDPLLTVVG
jgi:glycosyltransferase involved in cell wall biosynthesis